MKGLKIVVLAKQVPDTRNVGKDAMKADGTVNRAALPAIFNPEDLNALEQALRLKDTIEGTTVHVLTMGPGRAAEIIREAMYRGADGGYLLSAEHGTMQLVNVLIKQPVRWDFRIRVVFTLITLHRRAIQRHFTCPVRKWREILMISAFPV